jgi:hypothetical protein
MAERFDGRVQREVLGITVAGHRDLERLWSAPTVPTTPADHLC